MRSFFSVLVLQGIILSAASAQFFYESVGTGTSTTIAGYSGWDNGDPIHYEEYEALYNNDIVDSDPSTYEGASGGSCVRVGGGGSTFTISGLNTVGHPFLLLSFGNKCNFPAIDSVKLHVSTDNGTTWILLPVSGIKAYAWQVALAGEYLPQDENLHIRWTVNTELGWMDMRIDDITLADDDVTDPVIITDVIAMDFEEVTIGQLSTEQSYTLEGYNLAENITVAPPDGFQLSLTPGSGFSQDPIVLTATDGTVDPVTIYVKFSPTEVRTYAGSITHVSASSNQPEIVVTGTGLSDQPTILTGTVTDFGSQAINTYSAEQWYTVEGYNLTEDITIVPPTGFEVSTGSRTGFVAENPLVLPQSGGMVPPDTVYVRFRPEQMQNYTGTITHTSGTATSVVSVKGTGSIKQKYRARIVDYGSDLGQGYYRDNSNTARPGVAVDVDGDGSTSDDCVAYWEFSMDEPMNPSHIYFDEETPSATFFGGITAFFDSPNQRIIEGLINENHELRDDFNMMVVQSDNAVNKKAYGLWFWKKDFFLNGGDDPGNSVSFDASSLISVHISRYWSGLEGGRFLVSDQGQFYVSEEIFSGLRTSHTLVPTESRWAEYNPQEPYGIRFDPSAANWQNIAFNHVDAVGFYLFKDILDNNNVQLKWHSVEVWANIEREPASGYYTEMVEIPGGSFGGAIDPFFITSTEIPYHTWQEVYKWAVSNQYCFDIENSRGFVFDRDGDIGSMDYGSETHGSEEPATDMTWLDAVLWCNALSELEGYTPCYYADPAHTRILKQIKGRDNPEDYDNTYPVYVDYTANGYRLPTPPEWTYAATSGSGTAETGEASAWTNGRASTNPAGSLAANSWGVHDAIGNVWEYTWDVTSAGSSYDPNTDTIRTVLGGDFHSLEAPSEGRLPYGDTPGDGDYNIGFRVIRADDGAIPPASDETGSVPSWSFDDDLYLQNPSEIKPDSLLVESELIYLSGSYTFGSPDDDHYENDNLGFNRSDGAFVTITPFYGSKNEISFERWNEIYQWAVSNGYTFDRDGDMGSMDRATRDHTHQGTEPVTDVGWNDAVLWCNALSEYQGLDPVYYSDTTGNDLILRTANQWRLRMEHRPGYNGAVTTQIMQVIADFSKNGYRLPTSGEWEIMARDGSTSPGPGNLPSGDWYLGNAGNRTHPVGTVPANNSGFCDLGGNVQEWLWDWLSTNYYRAHNPKGTDKPDNLFGKGLAGSCFGSTTQSITERAKERESAARSYLGFRVVRCDAGEHPREDIFIPETVLEFDPSDYDPLTGKTFRNNLHRTGAYAASGIPEGPVSVKWKVDTEGPVSSSPILVNGTIYIGSEDGYLYAITASTGDVDWRYQCNGPITATPTFYEDVIYIGDHAGYFHAVYTKDDPAESIIAGTRKWRVRAATDRIEASASIAYGLAITGWQGWSNENKYIGFDIETGEEKWRYRSHRSNGGMGGLAIDTFSVYAPISDNVFMGADIATEISRWTATGLHAYNFSPIINEDLLGYACENFIKVVDRKTGSNVWSFYNGSNTDKNQYSSPGVGNIPFSNDTVKMIFYGQLAGSLFGLNALTGEELWRTEGALAYESSPSVADSLVYIGNNDGTMYARDARTGELAWSWDAGDAILSSPLPGENVLYFGCNSGSVYALTNSNVNQQPTIDPAESVSHTTLDPPEQQIQLYGIGDGDTGEQQLTITAVSSGPPVISDLTIDYNQGEATATLNYLLTGTTGSTTITVTVSDDGSINNSTSITFTITVTGFVNHPPTIDPVGDLNHQETDTSPQSLTLAGISDGNDGFHDLAFAVSSSNEDLFETLSIDYIQGSPTAKLNYTLTGSTGTAIITITVTDEGSGNNTVSVSFSITVGPSNVGTAEYNGILLTPNPTRESVRISVRNGVIDELRVINMSGEIILLKKPGIPEYTILKEELQPGTYTVVLKSGNDIRTAVLIRY